MTCACAGDGRGDGHDGPQGGITDWVAWRWTVAEVEMVKAGSGKQGGLGGEDGGQEEDGGEGGEEEDGVDKGGAFEQAAVMRCQRHQHRGCEKGGDQ